MKPKRAEQHIRLILDTQKTVSTERIREFFEVINSESKMLRVDNRKLRKRVKNQRKEINELKGVM